MYINFLRTGVGVESVHHLYEIQSAYRYIKHEGKHHAFLETRRTPTRVNEMLNGGSVYWIIKRQICVRQTIADIQTLKDMEGKAFCRIIMVPELILTSPVAHRHIQGWQYLMPEKAPQDLYAFDPKSHEDNDIDPIMAEELSEIGLL
jgi:hypothetical protein